VPSPESLVQSARQDNVQAFAQLAGLYERSLRAIAFAILRDQHLAQDAVQDALVSAWQHFHELRNAAAMPAWLAQITRNRALAMAAKKPQTVPLDESTAAQNSGLELDDERLLHALMKLDDDQRTVLLLRHFDNHPVTMIAEITGESVGTVTKRISRAHSRLRELLKEHADE
jgi:RNA polymerase sigma factor (sigma-70 family)